MVGSKKFTFATLINYLILGAVAFIILYPFWYMLVYSMSSYSEVVGKTALFVPRGFNFNAYKSILKDELFLTGYKNTLIVTLAGTIFSLSTTVLLAYPLSKNLKGNKVISFLIYLTMLFGGGMLPTYYVVRITKLLNTYWALILPNLVTPFNVFVVRNYLKDIPDSLSESAQLDGAGHFRILFSIILPLSLPILATIGLFYAVGYWNAYFNAILYIRDAALRPLQVLLREMVTQTQMDTTGSGMMIGADMGINSQTIKMAAIIASIVPIACVYPFLQKYFAKGLMNGAIKM
ncbi:MAG: carbohydrate ABC transporter permease [Spirochaetales bacterium]|nr:carbohydrate ABC transporter permease [Spirochaetales bacterium]